MKKPINSFTRTDFFKRYPSGRVRASRRRYTKERGILAGCNACSHRKPSFMEMLGMGWLHPFKK